MAEKHTHTPGPDTRWTMPDWIALTLFGWGVGCIVFAAGALWVEGRNG